VTAPLQLPHPADVGTHLAERHGIDFHAEDAGQVHAQDHRARSSSLDHEHPGAAPATGPTQAWLIVYHYVFMGDDLGPAKVVLNATGAEHAVERWLREDEDVTPELQERLRASVVSVELLGDGIITEYLP
jgi:hypothetical protein